MGCGSTLYPIHGALYCSNPECPRPTGASEILMDRETEHLVVFHEGVFTVRHPLRERLDMELMYCELADWVAINAWGSDLGTYRATALDGEDWILTKVEETE
jgi:hypothetical protein